MRRAPFIEPRMMAIGRRRGWPINHRTPSPSRVGTPAAMRIRHAAARNVPGMRTTTLRRRRRAASTKKGGAHDQRRQRSSGGPIRCRDTSTPTSVRWPSPVRRAHEVGHDRLGRIAGSTSAMPSSRVANSTRRCQPRTCAADRVDSIGARQSILCPEHGKRDSDGHDPTDDVHRDHRPATVDPVGDDAGREREQQPGKPLHHHDQSDQDRVAGDRGRQPGVGDHRHTVSEIGRDSGAEESAVVGAERIVDGCGYRAGGGALVCFCHGDGSPRMVASHHLVRVTTTSSVSRFS